MTYFVLLAEAFAAYELALYSSAILVLHKEGGDKGHRGRTTVSTSAGLPAFTWAMARRSAGAMSAGFSIGPSAYQPMLFAMLAKSGSGPAMSWAIWARSTGVPRCWAT